MVIEASSELASTDDRYAAENLASLLGRNLTWAEGVEGPGIGESITYCDSMYWNIHNVWEGLRSRAWYEPCFLFSKEHIEQIEIKV